ncbi:MAG: hypothetical protein DRJ03_00060 [Chloroflexi bacterium]|nr:MAG: hypothetical protein DRJ03_00060 [Chloroflexota bacterium]
MKITQWEAGDNPHEDSGRMALVTKQEALQIIRSLVHQLERLDAGLDPNDVRVEFYPHDEKYGYFSIAISNDPEALFRREKVGDVDCACGCPGDCSMADVAKCGRCGTNNRVEDDTLCGDCIDDDTCLDCDERYEDCCCDDEYGDNDCINCGLDPETCGCWDHSDGDCQDELDQENVADTFRPMNAFVRARWLMARRKL